MKNVLKHLKQLGLMVLGWLTGYLILFVMTGEPISSLEYRGLGYFIGIYLLMSLMLDFIRGPNK